MIPKIIHYCWFGHNPKPALAEKCLQSWKTYLPDYQILEWNEDNYDLSSAPLYVRQAYEAKKWAFVSDYVRFDVLFREGGVYFDTDVELIRSPHAIIENGAFMGCETDAGTSNGITVAPGLGLGCEAGNAVYAAVLAYYDGLSFLNSDGSLNTVTVVSRVTTVLKQFGLENKPGIQTVQGIKIYPSDFFCPINELGEKNNFSPNTISIHWYSASWYSENEQRQRAAWIKRNKRDRIVHFPNRLLRGLLGDDRYQKVKERIRRDAAD